MRPLFIILSALLINNFALASLFEKSANESYRKLPNTLTLHMVSSPYGINWKSKPRHVLWSLVKNRYLFPYTTRALGHVTVELNCDNKRYFSGQGVKDLKAFQRILLNDGVGFSILNSPRHLFNDLPLLTVKGKMENEEDLVKEFDKYLTLENKMSFLTYQVKQEQCLKMVSFFKNYKAMTHTTEDHDQPKAGNNYGFGADPLKYQGAGCAPYAEAFFRISNLEDEFKKFKQTVYIDKSLLGNKNNRVEVLDLLLSNSDISKPGKNKRTFSFADPDLMHNFVLKTSNNKNKEKNIIYSGTFGTTKAQQVIIDLR